MTNAINTALEPCHSPQSQNALARSPLFAGHSNSAAQTSFQPELVHCVYLGFHCRTCGELRQALSSAPDDSQIPCPHCHELKPFTVLGTGLTARPLPLYEIHLFDVCGERKHIPWDRLRPARPGASPESGLQPATKTRPASATAVSTLAHSI